MSLPHECPFCYANQEKQTVITSHVYGGEDRGHSFFYCSNCDIRYLYPGLTTEEEKRFYSAEFEGFMEGRSGKKGGWKKHTQSVSGKLPWRPKYINILIAFKGLKTGKAAGATTTDMKEGMVGLMFQSDIKSPVTQQNIKKIHPILIKNISGIQAETSKTKKGFSKR